MNDIGTQLKRYRNSADSKSWNDYKAVLNWIESGNAPGVVAQFKMDNIDLRSKDIKTDSIVSKGVKCLLFLNGAKDLMTNESLSVTSIEDDHFFPNSGEALYMDVNSALNLVLLTKATNRFKGNKSPAMFRADCLAELRPSGYDLEQVWSSQFVTAAAIDAVKNDDFEMFLHEREAAITEFFGNLISQG